MFCDGVPAAIKLTRPSRASHKAPNSHVKIFITVLIIAFMLVVIVTRCFSSLNIHIWLIITNQIPTAFNNIIGQQATPAWSIGVFMIPTIQGGTKPVKFPFIILKHGQ